MGNTSPSTLPTNFTSKCHPQLQIAQINKTNNTLQIKIHPGIGFSNWKWNLNPLQPYTKHLFGPSAFIDTSLLDNESNTSWCISNIDLLKNQRVILVRYQPYIYTLENQIIARKSKNHIFKQYQIWKILKAGIHAIADWSNVYQDCILNTITPRNIIFNQQGSIKFVHRFSFIEQEFQELQSEAYIPAHWQIINGNKLSVEFANEFPLSLSIYSLGITLLDTASLTLPRYCNKSMQEKKKILVISNNYQLEIINMILGMIEISSSKRITINQIIQHLKRYKVSNK